MGRPTKMLSGMTEVTTRSTIARLPRPCPPSLSRHRRPAPLSAQSATAYPPHCRIRSCFMFAETNHVIKQDGYRIPLAIVAKRHSDAISVGVYLFFE